MVDKDESDKIESLKQLADKLGIENESERRKFLKEHFKKFSNEKVRREAEDRKLAAEVRKTQIEAEKRRAHHQHEIELERIKLEIECKRLEAAQQFNPGEENSANITTAQKLSQSTNAGTSSAAPSLKIVKQTGGAAGVNTLFQHGQHTHHYYGNEIPQVYVADKFASNPISSLMATSYPYTNFQHSIDDGDQESTMDDIDDPSSDDPDIRSVSDISDDIDAVVENEDQEFNMGEIYDPPRTSCHITSGQPTETDLDWSSTSELEDESRYKMNKPERGCFIIFNHTNFDLYNKNRKESEHLQHRKGTNKDALNLENTVKQLGFEYVVVIHDATKSEILAWMQLLSTADHSNYDCFGCAILTHGGDRDVLYARDEAMQLTDFTRPFRADRCPSLARKPKLFFIQACRGVMFDPGKKVKLLSNTLDVVDGPLPSSSGDTVDGVSEREVTIPAEADFLIANSTVPEYYSWRNESNGSFFIQSLCAILNLYGDSMELIQMMTRVNRMVAYDYESSTNNNTSDKKKQIPSIATRLTAEVFFLPKPTSQTFSEIQVSMDDNNHLPKSNHSSSSGSTLENSQAHTSTLHDDNNHTSKSNHSSSSGSTLENSQAHSSTLRDDNNHLPKSNHSSCSGSTLENSQAHTSTLRDDNNHTSKSNHSSSSGSTLENSQAHTSTLRDPNHSPKSNHSSSSGSTLENSQAHTSTIHDDNHTPKSNHSSSSGSTLENSQAHTSTLHDFLKPPDLSFYTQCDSRSQLIDINWDLPDPFKSLTVSPLFVAAFRGNMKKVKRFRYREHDRIRAKLRGEMTPLVAAFLGGHNQIYLYLLGEGWALEEMPTVPFPPNFASQVDEALRFRGM